MLEWTTAHMGSLQSFCQVTLSRHSGRHSCSELRVLGGRPPSPPGWACLHLHMFAVGFGGGAPGCSLPAPVSHCRSSRCEIWRTPGALPHDWKLPAPEGQAKQVGGPLDLHASLCARLFIPLAAQAPTCSCGTQESQRSPCAYQPASNKGLLGTPR